MPLVSRRKHIHPNKSQTNLMRQTTIHHQVKEKAKSIKSGYVFVLQLHDKSFVIGQASNPCRRISAINSGLNRAIPKALQIKKIVGIKERTKARNLISVVSKFCDRYGIDNVITV